MSDPNLQPDAPPIPYATPSPRRPVRTAVVLAVLALAAVVAIGLVMFWLATPYTVTVTVSPAPPAPPATVPAPMTAVPAPAPPPPLPLPPPRMNLTAPQPFSVPQRRSWDIPGSAGTVRVQLGDINGVHGGEVRRDVVAKDGQTLAGRTARPGDAVEFAVNGARFVVVAIEFDRHLARPDVARLLVRRAEDPVTDEEHIARLIDAAADTGATVVWTDPADAAVEPRLIGEYLRDVWSARRARVKKPPDLVREAALPFGVATGPPRIKLPAGGEADLGPWLSGLEEKQP
jgi:hypothetical protein